MLSVYAKLNEHQEWAKVKCANCLTRFEALIVFTIFVFLSSTVWVQYAWYKETSKEHPITHIQSIVVLVITFIKFCFDIILLVVFFALGLEFNREVMDY